MSQWIGTAEVAEEMGWGLRQAYEFVRQIGVPCVGCGIEGVRFARPEYEAARDAASAPLPSRKPYGRQGEAEAAPVPAPRVKYPPKAPRTNGRVTLRSVATG